VSTDTKARRWDVRTDAGDLVNDLDTLAAMLGTNPTAAALTLLANDSAYKAAPPALQEEVARAVETKGGGRPKPGGGTPPPITSGSFVQWGSNRGRVDLIVTNGKVPGVEEDVSGAKDSPAVRVVVWESDGNGGYKPSRKKVGKMAHTLKRIQPLRSGKSAAPAEDLVTLLAEHEARDLPAHAQVSALAVKAVYDRGAAEWPGYDKVDLSRRQWATSRVKAFLAVAAGDDPAGYVNDLGLLSKSHPRHPGHRAEDWVEIGRDDLERTLASLTE
jgi:hypothetical protein